MKRKIFPVISDNDKKLPYYLIGAGYDWEQEHIVSKQGFHNQWIQCIKGEGELVLNNKKYRVKEGSGMFLYANIPHEYYSVSPSWIVEWIVFGGDQVEPFLKNIVGMKHSGVYYVSRPDIISSRIRTATNILDSDYTLKNIQCSSIIYSLMTDFLQYASSNLNNSTLNKYHKVKPVLDYIDQNYSKPLSIKELAVISSITPEYLSTLFKKTTNINLSNYINLVRIKKSKEMLLQYPNIPIKAIALDNGFDDVNYFNLVFKKLENMSPGQFRKIYT